MSRYQHGHVYEAFSAFHVQYYQSEIKDGKTIRVRRSHRLCAKDRVHYSATSKAVQKLCADFMSGVNEDVVVGKDTPIADFWTKYLHYCEHEYKGRGMKPSTVRGFKQVWNQFLEGHFGKRTLQEYQAGDARAFLASLKTTQVSSTLKHIRGLAGAMFTEAIERGLRKDANPWRVKIPKECKESEQTQHYTLEEVENLVSALVDHVDAQLVMALSCFLGLRPGEIAALRWEDFDKESVHIRRSVVRGNVGTPKTPESVATLPIIDQVRIPLELWRQRSQSPKEGWVFPSRNDTPNRENRNTTAVGIVQSINQVQIARATTPGTHRQAPGQMRFRSSSKCGRLFVPDVNPFDSFVGTDCVRDPVERISRRP
jgi:integrase